MFEAEDVLMEDKPLRSHRKSLKTPTNAEEEYIQQAFADFDFKVRAASDRHKLMEASMAMEQELANKHASSILSSRLSAKDLSVDAGEIIQEGTEEDDEEQQTAEGD